MSDVYEAGTTRLFEVLLKPGMTIVDVGAHIGYCTVLASRLVGQEGEYMPSNLILIPLPF
jgi:predicted methyltransferase